jgi:hypothetical protein
LSPGFSFCLKTKFSISKTAENLVQAIEKSEYLSLFLQLRGREASFCFKVRGKGGRGERPQGAACSRAPRLGYCIQLRKATAGLPCPPPPPRFVLQVLYTGYIGIGGLGSGV